jgi:zinc transport system ATP-binding protein
MDQADPAEPVVVEFRDAAIGYEGQPVIDGLSLRISRGEVVGVLGPNGSGKSTLVGGILGLAKVQSGTIELFGVDRARFREWDRIGFVPQRGTVTGGIPSTVREVVASGRLTSLKPFRRMRASDHEMIDRSIAAVGLADRSRKALSTLSGGQQRRALIARALASDPGLLVLDEPTAGVDSENQLALANILARLAGQGTTIILITHELGPAAGVVTRTLVLNNGRVVHDGPGSVAPGEHDDEWHHHHGPPSRPGSGLGLDGLA